MMPAKRPKILRLPDNPYRRQQLEAKLKEYARRLPDDELTELIHLETAAKLIVLHCLLESEHGQVDTDDIYAALKSGQHDLWEMLELFPLIYDNACLVIANYCSGDYEKNVGGTGLFELN